MTGRAYVLAKDDATFSKLVEVVRPNNAHMRRKWEEGEGEEERRMKYQRKYGPNRETENDKTRLAYCLLQQH